MRPLFSAGLALLLVTALTSPTLAAWPNSPFTNVALCTAANNQSAPAITPDGAGGAIVTWVDNRSDTTHIYAQRVLASGAVDPAWPIDGVQVSSGSIGQEAPQIVADGAGGAIIAWQDLRNGNYDVYVQHVLAAGAVDWAWPFDGRLLSGAGDNKWPQIATDGAGGAFITWNHQPGSDPKNYAHHVLATGALDPAWPVTGLAVAVSDNDQHAPQLVADGAGGVIIAWGDTRNLDPQIYAQHLLASGADPAWPAGGVEVVFMPAFSFTPQLVSDGAGGAIVTWDQSGNIYARHLLASGTMDPAWPAGGRALCTAANTQNGQQIVSDGAGGAIVTWQDTRSGNVDIYAQHVLASGFVDPSWPFDGRALCTEIGDQQSPQIVADGAGGAIVTWQDLRLGAGFDIAAQRVLASGAVDPAWPVEGRALCTAGSSQQSPQIVADEAGGVIVAWEDARSDAGDIYAQRVARYGYLGTPEPEIVAVTDVPNDQGGRVKVSWNASYLESDPYSLVTHYRVFRSVPPNLVAALQAAGARVMRSSDAEALGFERPGDLLATVSAGTTYYWEYLATVNVDFLPNYSYLAPTAGDSSATAFMVQARTLGSQHWESPPMIGISADNLAPVAPAPFTGTFNAGTTYMTWNANTEPDLAGYRLYRSTSYNFVPGPENLIATLVDINFADAAGSPHYYKLSAFDIHGNASAATTLTLTGTVSVGGEGSLAFGLEGARPNPASGSDLIVAFTLPAEGAARLVLLDVSGRRMLEREVGSLGVGRHTVNLAEGNRVASGLYWLQLTQGESRRTTRVVVTR